MDEIKNITLKDWELVGGGGNADSYFNKNDDTIMLKLSKNAGRNKLDMEEEIKIAKLVNQININTPKMICEVKCDGRKGIIYERLKNKKSISQLCHENPEKIEYYAKIYANEAFKLHSMECNIEGIPDNKKRMLEKYEKRRRDDKIIDDLIKTIKEELEDSKNYLHGDLTLGNLVLSQDKYYWIDTGKFSYGDPITDLTTVFFSYNVLGKFGFVQKIFHLDHNQLTLFGSTLLKEYARLKEVDYDKLIEKIEKLSVLWAHGIWITSTAPKLIRDTAKFVAKKYQWEIEKKRNLKKGSFFAK